MLIPGSSIQYDPNQFSLQSGKLHLDHFAIDATDGVRRIAIGLDCEDSTGVYDTLLGHRAGRTSTTGFNTLIGSNCGETVADGFANTGGGALTMSNTSGPITRNTAWGYYNQTTLQAGKAYYSAVGNTSVGSFCMSTITTGNENVAFGYYTLYFISEGYRNLGIGSGAGRMLKPNARTISSFADAGGGKVEATYSGDALSENDDIRISGSVDYDGLYEITNVTATTFEFTKAFVADGTGLVHLQSDANENVLVGVLAARASVHLGQSVVMGTEAGYNAEGNGHVLIGHKAGYNETGDNKLYIANSDTSDPLIYGEFDNSFVTINGYLNANYFVSDVAVGTQPFQCTSTTKNTNLNADLWDGQDLPTLDSGKYLSNNGVNLSWEEIDLSGYVPYTGATGSVDLGSYNLSTTGDVSAQSVTFTYPGYGDYVFERVSGYPDYFDLRSASGKLSWLRISTTDADGTDTVGWSLKSSGSIQAWFQLIAGGVGGQFATQGTPLSIWAGKNSIYLSSSSWVTGYGPGASSVSGSYYHEFIGSVCLTDWLYLSYPTGDYRIYVTISRQFETYINGNKKCEYDDSSGWWMFYDDMRINGYCVVSSTLDVGSYVAIGSQAGTPGNGRTLAVGHAQYSTSNPISIWSYLLTGSGSYTDKTGVISIIATLGDGNTSPLEINFDAETILTVDDGNDPATITKVIHYRAGEMTLFSDGNDNATVDTLHCFEAQAVSYDDGEGDINNIIAFYDEGQTTGKTINWGLGINTQSYINASLSLGKATAPNSVLDVEGASRLGGSSNYISISSSGDISFVGTAGFYPVRSNQSAQPTPDTGELIIWRDSDDGKIYLIYNDTDTGAKKVELAA